MLKQILPRLLLSMLPVSQLASAQEGGQAPPANPFADKEHLDIYLNQHVHDLFE